MRLIHTAQIARWRTLKAYAIPMLDITAKSGNPAFAPHWSDLQAYRLGAMSIAEYDRRYVAKMRESYRTHHHEWVALTSEKWAGAQDIALVCYCRPDAPYCHRFAFQKMLCKHLRKYDIEAVAGVEITAKTHPPIITA